MAEKPIKVDEQTDRMVSDLAHFLRSTKKAVVRDAVAEYAESRHALMAIGADSSARLVEVGDLGEGWAASQRAKRPDRYRRAMAESHPL